MRVLVVDDHPIMRLGVRQLISDEWPESQVVEAASLSEAIAICTIELPDIVVLDMSLPDATGVEGASRMLSILKDTPILVLSLNPETAYAPRLIQMGIAGYLPKDLAGEELVNAMRRILGGGRYVTASMSDHLLDLLSGKRPHALPHEQLSAQELRVMVLMSAGTTPALIATTMGISVKTVGTYRARILEKGGWKNNTELTKYCIQHGLTGPE